jgi:hypothetical protein|nr:MAG TPA: helix-turn-helix domain protein [Caudoviricetes sp.]
MGKLTSRQKKEIIARYVSGEKVTQIAKSYNISHQAISKILKSDTVAESCKQLQIQDFATMTAYIESKREQVQEVIDAVIDALQDKLYKTTFKDCVLALKELSGLYIEREQKAEDKTNNPEDIPVIKFVFDNTSIHKDDNDDKQA